MLTINNFGGMDALRIRTMGDSITEGLIPTQSPGIWGWVDAPGGLYDQISPGIAAKSGPSVSTRPAIIAPSATISKNVGYPASCTPISLKPAQLTKHGFGGSTVTFVTDWQLGHPERINNSVWSLFVTQRADLFIIQWAINDWTEIALGAYDANTHLLAYGAVMDRIHADYPDAKIACMGCLFITQAWSSSGGNHFTGGLGLPGGNPFDNNNPVDQNIRTCVAARSGYSEYVDLVSQALAYTVATIPEPGPNGGIGWPGNLSMNGLHPTLLGQQLMGTWVGAHLNIVTT